MSSKNIQNIKTQVKCLQWPCKAQWKFPILRVDSQPVIWFSLYSFVTFFTINILTHEYIFVGILHYLNCSSKYLCFQFALSVRLMRDVSKYCTILFGGQYAMIRGVLFTQVWFADNLVLQSPCRFTKVVQFLMEVDKSGWMMLLAAELSHQ